MFMVASLVGALAESGPAASLKMADTRRCSPKRRMRASARCCATAWRHSFSSSPPSCGNWRGSRRVRSGSNLPASSRVAPLERSLLTASRLEASLKSGKASKDWLRSQVGANQSPVRCFPAFRETYRENLLFTVQATSSAKQNVYAGQCYGSNSLRNGTGNNIRRTAIEQGCRDVIREATGR